MSLFSMDATTQEKRNAGDQRMAMLDQINRIMGPGTLFHAAEGVGTASVRKRGQPRQNLRSTERWRMRSQFKSPSYTTRWSDLAQVC